MEESDFNQLLVQLSDAISKKDEKYVDMLRILYTGLENVGTIALEEAKSAFNLFQILIGAGFLKPTDISILFETIELTGLIYLKEIIEKYETYPDEVKVTQFSSHRQQLVALGKGFSLKDLQRVSQLHGGNFLSNPWKLIQHLEHTCVLTEVKMPSFLQHLKENEVNTDFNQLLVELSDAINKKDEKYVDMLRVLYTDLAHVKTELEDAKSAFDLFQILIVADILKPTDISVLFETIELTGLKYLKKIIEKYEEVYPYDVNITKFSQHRQHVVALGKDFSTLDVQRVRQKYEVPVKFYSNPWKLITYLESEGIVSEDKFSSFLRNLKTIKRSIGNDDDADDDGAASSSSGHHQSSQDDERRPHKRSKFMFPSKQDVLVREYLLERQQIICQNANRFTPAILNTRYQIDIAHMFTDLDLLKQHKRKQDAEQTNLEEVLSIIKSIPACKVLVEGEGGIGKTTLLRYIAYKWANKELDETFKDKILFMVNIRDMDKGEDILDVIVKQMELKDFNLKTNLPEDPKLLKRFIMNHDDEIVFLLDGLDELEDGNESPIRLFKKEKLGNSTVIITSRSEQLDEFINESSVHVKVKGFNADSIQKYIKKHFDFLGETALGDSLVRELKLTEYEWKRGNKHKEVCSMCRNPMLLFSVCTMWEEKQHLPADKTDLLKEVFRCILNQFIDKNEANTKKISNFKDTPERFVNAMLVLGKCMYEGLKRNQLSINKRDLEGSEESVALAVKLGFVYKDAPSLKSCFEEFYTAPHKLIVELLVGFYLYKRCEVDFENVPLEDSGHLLKPIDGDEREVIRGNKYLLNTRLFAIGFLGGDAWKIFTYWITNSFNTLRSLMSYFEFVKEEHRIHVEEELIGHMTKTDLETDPHIDNISNTLRKFIRHVNPSVEVNEDEHLIKLMRRIHNINLHVGQLKSFFKENSSEETGKMLAHILIAVPNQEYIFGEFHKSYDASADDNHVKYLTSECQKLNFKYDIKELRLYITDSCLVHVLSNAPELTILSLKSSNCVNVLFREDWRGFGFKLVILCIRDNNLSHIDGYLFASLLIIAPKLKYLNIGNCRLSGVVMNDMIRAWCKRGVNLEVRSLDISENNLSNIKGCLLASLFVIGVRLEVLDMRGCSVSAGVIDDMVRCSEYEVDDWRWRGRWLKLAGPAASSWSLSSLSSSLSSLSSSLSLLTSLLSSVLSSSSLSSLSSLSSSLSSSSCLLSFLSSSWSWSSRWWSSRLSSSRSSSSPPPLPSLTPWWYEGNGMRKVVIRRVGDEYLGFENEAEY